jgi:hypothetical protein
MFVKEIISRESSDWYHATSLINAIKILKTDVLLGKTKHVYNGDTIIGTSLTRDKRFASKWGNVIFVFDSRKIKYNNKVIPIDFKDYAKHYKVERRANREEFVIGDIHNVKQKTLEILISRVEERSEYFDELQDICDSEGIILTIY